MDHEDRLVIKNAIKLYEDSGVGAYSLVQRLADMYVGDGSKREEILEKISKNGITERISIECMFGAQQSEWIMSQPRDISKKLIENSGAIIGLTCFYIQSRLENQNERRKAREFIDDLVND